MLDDMIDIDPKLLRLYEEEFKIDFSTHCLSADDAIRLFPHTKLAFASIEHMKHEHLVQISHAFPVFLCKIPFRSSGFFVNVGRHIGKLLLDDRVVNKKQFYYNRFHFTFLIFLLFCF